MLENFFLTLTFMISSINVIASSYLAKRITWLEIEPGKASFLKEGENVVKC